MNQEYKYPPDTSWMPRSPAGRRRFQLAYRVVLLLILLLIVLRIVDRLFLDDSLYNVARVLWYELNGIRWT
jgi:hypothetical protein